MEAMLSPRPCLSSVELAAAWAQPFFYRTQSGPRWTWCWSSIRAAVGRLKSGARRLAPRKGFTPPVWTLKFCAASSSTAVAGRFRKQMAWKPCRWPHSWRTCGPKALSFIKRRRWPRCTPARLLVPTGRLGPPAGRSHRRSTRQRTANPAHHRYPALGPRPRDGHSLAQCWNVEPTIEPRIAEISSLIDDLVRSPGSRFQTPLAALLWGRAWPPIAWPVGS